MAVVLTLVQTKQIRIYIKETTQKTQYKVISRFFFSPARNLKKKVFQLDH